MQFLIRGGGFPILPNQIVVGLDVDRRTGWVDQEKTEGGKAFPNVSAISSRTSQREKKSTACDASASRATRRETSASGCSIAMIFSRSFKQFYELSIFTIYIIIFFFCF